MNEPTTPADNQNAPMAVASGAVLGCPFMVGQRLKSKRPGWHGKEDIEEVTAAMEKDKS